MSPNLDGLEVFMITPKDKDDVYRIFKDYYVGREPLCIGVHLTHEEFVPMLDDVIPHCLASQASFGLRDKKTKEMVGFRLNRIMSPEENETLFKTSGYPSEKCNRYSRALYNLSSDIDILKRGKFKKQLELQCMSISPAYSKRGLGDYLVKISIAKAKEMGCDLVTVQSVNAVTQHIYEKFGFQEVKRLNNREALVEGGECLLDFDAMHQANGTTHLSYLIKEI